MNPHVVFKGGQFDTLMAMLSAGAGVTLLPEIAHSRYRRGDVGLLEFAPTPPTRTVGIVRAKRKFLTPAAAAFIGVLRSLAAQRLNRDDK